MRRSVLSARPWWWFRLVGILGLLLAVVAACQPGTGGGPGY
jgi:uncharacterized membrane protein HdeD (DUF308 family)